METERRDRLYRKAIRGELARSALEALETYRVERERGILSELFNAENPAKAFDIACEYRAMMRFFNGASADVSVGREATDDLEREE